MYVSVVFKAIACD